MFLTESSYAWPVFMAAELAMPCFMRSYQFFAVLLWVVADLSRFEQVFVQMSLSSFLPFSADFKVALGSRVKAEHFRLSFPAIGRLKWS